MSDNITQDFQDRLVELLCKIPALREYQNREMLLRGLPPGPAGAINRNKTIYQIDLHVIVQAVASWERVKSGEYALKILFKNARRLVEGLQLESELHTLEEEFDRLKGSETPQPSPQRVPFTNREDEIKVVLSSFSPAYYLLDAPAGYGKTELLRELEHRFQEPEQGWRCAYVAVEENGTLAELATALARKLDVVLVEDPELPWGWRLGGALQAQWRSAPKKGLALLIDLDKRPALSIVKELLEEFIPAIQESLYLLKFFEKNHNRFRVILAGRYLAASKEVRATSLSLKDLHLTPFNYDVIQDSAGKYLTDYGHENIQQLAAHLLYFTGGHPGCMARVLEMYKQRSIPPDRFLKSFSTRIWAEVVCRAVEDIRTGIPESFNEFHKVLDRLSVSRYQDYAILRYIIQEDSISGISSEYSLADKLTATYLFSWKGRLLRDAITRRLLAIRLRHEMPEEFSDLCRQARDMCTKRLQDPRVQRPEIWVVEYLFQSLQQHANVIRNKARRRSIRNTFLDKDVPKALQMFIEGRNIPLEAQQGEQDALEQEMAGDWEFRFTVNYYLREDQYSNEPYNELKQKIEDFFT